MLTSPRSVHCRWWRLNCSTVWKSWKKCIRTQRNKVNLPEYGNELATFLKYISPSGFMSNQARRESCKNGPKFQRLEQNLILWKFSCPWVKYWAGFQTYLLTFKNKSSLFTFRYDPNLMYTIQRYIIWNRTLNYISSWSFSPSLTCPWC